MTSIARQILEALSYTYQMPDPEDDLKRVILDFYLWGFIQDRIKGASTRGNLSGESTSMDLEEIANEAMEKLEGFLYPALGVALVQGIIGELEHVDGDVTKFGALRHELAREDEPVPYSSGELTFGALRKVIAEIEQDFGGYGMAAYKSLVSKVEQYSGMSFSKFLEIAEKLYADKKNEIGWRHQYGGEAWATVTRGLERFRNTKLFNRRQAIDHAFDLQHNTGMAINKVPIFEHPSLEQWLSDKRDLPPQALAYMSSLPEYVLGYYQHALGIPLTRASGATVVPTSIPDASKLGRFAGISDTSRSLKKFVDLAKKYYLTLPTVKKTTNGVVVQYNIPWSKDSHVKFLDVKGGKVYWQLGGPITVKEGSTMETSPELLEALLRSRTPKFMKEVIAVAAKYGFDLFEQQFYNPTTVVMRKNPSKVKVKDVDSVDILFGKSNRPKWAIVFKIGAKMGTTIEGLEDQLDFWKQRRTK